MANNYTLGKGKLYFARFLPGTTTPEGERYIGNTPEFNVTMSETKLDHFSSDSGVKQKDDSVSLQVDRTGSFTTDNISVENLALFFSGASSTVSITGATVTDEVISNVAKDRYYQLGVTSGNMSGARDLDVHTGPSTNIIVKDSTGTTTYVENTDYTIDMVTGRLYIMPTGGITGSSIKVSYKTKTATRARVISGSTTIEGQLRFVSENPKGTKIDYFMPKVALSPNGDFALKSEEWQTIQFNVEINKLDDNTEAIYADGRSLT